MGGRGKRGISTFTENPVQGKTGAEATHGKHKWANKGVFDMTPEKPNGLTKAEATHEKPKWAHKGTGDTWETPMG